jgi:hypothetical protein
MGIRVGAAELLQMHQPSAPAHNYTTLRVRRLERLHSPDRQKRASRCARQPIAHLGRLAIENFLPISYQIQT